MFTNETINIWSHVLGVVWFVYKIVELNIFVLPSYKLSTVSFSALYFAIMTGGEKPFHLYTQT